MSEQYIGKKSTRGELETTQLSHGCQDTGISTYLQGRRRLKSFEAPSFAGSEDMPWLNDQHGQKKEERHFLRSVSSANTGRRNTVYLYSTSA